MAAQAASAATAVSFSPPPPVVSTASGPSVAPALAPSVAAAVASPEVTPAAAEDAPSSWPDEAAESAFRAEARDRGETVTAPAAIDVPEPVDPKSLPPLNSLVQRIPSNVRETLEDLFRARFVKVDQIPAKALKG